MKSKKTRYLIPLLILVIIITFCSFSCSTPGPAKQTIEEPAQETAEEITVEEPEEEPAEEVAADEPVEEPSEEKNAEIEKSDEDEDFVEDTTNEDKEQNSNIIEVKCIRVVDGDTIEIEDENGTKHKVRYIGINTPETDEYYGDIATEKNKELVEGKIVKLEKDVSETDMYGRLLRYVYVGDLFINSYLVENGYAQVATYPPDVKYTDSFLELEKEARENRRGFWGEEDSATSENETSNEEEVTEEETQDSVPQEEQLPEEESQEVTYGISIVSLTSPINRGAQASITINTAPNIQCSIIVYYKSGPSKAKGLEPKNSDGNGNCTWSWKVGARTTPGDWEIVLTAEGVGQKETYFTVTE